MSRTNNTTSSLLASLTGDDFQAAATATSTVQDTMNGDNVEEQDLFGDIPIDNDPVSASSLFETAVSEEPPMQQAVGSSSLLASSGLLPTDKPSSGGGGGGLFDQVDQQEKEEAERQRQEQLLAAQKQKEAEEKERLRLEAEKQAQQQAILQQQQQQQQQQMLQQQQQPQYSNFGQPQYTNVPLQSSLTDPMNQMSLNGAAQIPGHAQPAQTPNGYQPNPVPAAATATMQNQTNGGVLSPTQGGFYRSHPQDPQPGPVPAMQQQQPPGASYMYSNTASNVQQQQAAFAPSTTTQGRYSNTNTVNTGPSFTAGLHNGPNTSSLGQQLRQAPQEPAPVIPVYGEIKVSDPLLEQPMSLLGFSSPPHWTYQVTTTLLEGGCWIVRRRFRHVVALEDRLRMDCAGAILPPRPDKHATRAIEEASSSQSAAFAIRRMEELKTYLNALASHPICCKSQMLRLFLALQDDVGTAWPEVSPNALTRLGSVTQGVASKMADTVAGGGNLLEGNAPGMNMPGTDVGEDNAELIALSNAENSRIAAVLQAVPKLEGCVFLLREESESAGHVGMEMSKLAKDVEGSDRELSVPLEVLSQGLLRGSRRSKRLGVELSAAMSSYVYQYKLCKNEKAAFQDRRNALIKRQKQRGKADARAQRLTAMQRQTQGFGQLNRMEMEATVSDEIAHGAVAECDEVGERLKSEVNRVSFLRRKEWSKSMKVIASSMKEASSERTAIWESTREAFLQAFPNHVEGTSGDV
mmetsp:Transcript_25602/g.36080  ORF Transcript_25602/g.36080 Transcript_25602/m.36080 type:complete len:748 (+) Transcript_25602:147-2390(+)